MPKRLSSLRLEEDVLKRIDSALEQAATQYGLPATPRNAALEQWVVQGLERLEHQLKERKPKTRN